MSRVAKAPVAIPAGVEVKLNGQEITVKGAKGELSRVLNDAVVVAQEESNLTFGPREGVVNAWAQAGTARALVNNMVVGVSEGYSVKLQMVGVGFRAATQGQQLNLSLGYSHPIVFELPAEVKVVAETNKGEAPLVTLTSHDKQLLGMVAAKIRSLRKVEPYKGKGVRFLGEQIRRKAGKTAAK